jgi:glycine/D-amino acid oxidase-like deaminating enzyme
MVKPCSNSIVLGCEMDEFDAITIGSGMGGMTCAAALSRVGRKVLLLEPFTAPSSTMSLVMRVVGRALPPASWTTGIIASAIALPPPTG